MDKYDIDVVLQGHDHTYSEHISYRVMGRHMINSQKQKIQQITQKKTTATKSLIQQKVERL